MNQPYKGFLAWWLSGTIAYGIIAGCLAVMFGFIGAWSFGMSGAYPVLFHSKLLFPTQILIPLPESFDIGEVFAHSFSSGLIYSAYFSALIVSLKKNNED